MDDLVVPMGDDPIIVRPTTKQRVETLAHQIAGAIRHELRRQGDVEDIRTWVLTAKAFGCTVHRMKSLAGDRDPGFYEPRRRLLFYNGRAPEADCIRFIAHELAHDVVAHWDRCRYRQNSLELYDDHRATFQHRVARQVEELILG
jgi:Zn-dependent peptidase ImmA (M78 family)